MGWVLRIHASGNSPEPKPITQTFEHRFIHLPLPLPQISHASEHVFVLCFLSHREMEELLGVYAGQNMTPGVMNKCVHIVSSILVSFVVHKFWDPIPENSFCLFYYYYYSFE